MMIGLNVVDKSAAPSRAHRAWGAAIAASFASACVAMMIM